MTANLNFKVTIGLDALDVLCAQLTHDLFAIAKFLVNVLVKEGFRVWQTRDIARTGAVNSLGQLVCEAG